MAKDFNWFRVIPNGINISFTETFSINNPQLWSPDSPYLYQVISQIKDAKTGDIIDESMHPLGVRWFKFDPQNGFFLNGKYSM